MLLREERERDEARESKRRIPLDIWWRALEATTGAFNVHRTLRQCCKIALDFHRQVIFSQQFSFSFHISLLTSPSNSFFLIQIPFIDITSNVCEITSEVFVFYSLHSQISLRKKLLLVTYLFDFREIPAYFWRKSMIYPRSMNREEFSILGVTFNETRTNFRRILYCYSRSCSSIFKYT